MLYREIIAVCSQIHTKHINTVCGQNSELIDAFAKSETRCHVCPSAWYCSALIGRIYTKFDRLFWKPVYTNSHLHLQLWISRASLLKIRNVLDKICSENKIKHFFALWRFGPLVGHGLALSKLHDHTQTHRTRQDSSGRAISPTQRPLPDNTQHSQQTRHPCPRRDSNPQSQQGSGSRPTP